MDGILSRITMTPFAPIRSRAWLRGPKVGSIAGTEWLRTIPKASGSTLTLWPKGPGNELQPAPTESATIAVHRFGRVVRCTPMIATNPVIDRAGGGLERSTYDRHAAATWITVHDVRGLSQIPAAQSKSVEKWTISPADPSSRLTVRVQTPADRSRSANAPSQGAQAVPGQHGFGRIRLKMGLLEPHFRAL